MECLLNWRFQEYQSRPESNGLVSVFIGAANFGS
jgi:hypothetical protein